MFPQKTFELNSGSGFLLANKGNMISAGLVLPFSYITSYLYAVLIIIQNIDGRLIPTAEVTSLIK